MDLYSFFSLASLFIPVLFVAIVFRREWPDRELLRAAIAGFFSGAGSMLFVKIFLYPSIRLILGVNIHEFVLEGESIMVKLIAGIFIVGSLEEVVKLGGSVLGLAIAGAGFRPAVVFIALVFSGLGFAVLESLDYANLIGYEVLFLRVPISSTGHMVFSGIFGAFAAYAFSQRTAGSPRTILALFTGFAAASVLHGIFNFIALELPLDTAVVVLMVVLAFGVAFLRESWVRVLVWDSRVQNREMICERCLEHASPGSRFCHICGTRVKEF